MRRRRQPFHRDGHPDRDDNAWDDRLAMNETPIIKHLRELTAEALREAAEREERERAAEVARARQIIDGIVPLAEEQAKAGQHFAVIMEVSYRGRPRLFQEPTPFQLDPENLTGASRVVWDHCVDAGLNPVLVGRWTQIRDSLHRVDFSLVIRW
jgi:hypothetical protein